MSLGKEIIFYKEVHTPEGKNALAGHTASIAGDYMVCEPCIVHTLPEEMSLEDRCGHKQYHKKALADIVLQRDAQLE